MVAPFSLETLHAPAAPPGPGQKGRHALPTHRRHHRGRRVVLAVLLVAAAGAGAFAGVRLSAPQAPPKSNPVLAGSVSVPAAPVPLPWPATGQAAVAIPALGVTETSGPEQPVSVASMTKLMTAYVLLRDHPLALDEQGPAVTVSAADVSDYNDDAAQNNSSALVAAGEQLSEAQLLGGLLVHSADNYADMLANWDAGSTAAFVTKMNAAAAELGMTSTHFADASGVSPASVSTASDILKVASADMENPVVAADVRMPAVTLPVAGTIRTYTPLVGLFGVVGVKSGYSTTAGGCDVLGVVRQIDGRPVLLLAAVTGQTGQDVLAQAGLHGLALVSAMVPHITSLDVVHEHQLVARVSRGGRAVAATATAPASVLTWPGVTAHRRYVAARDAGARTSRGAVVGSVLVTLGTQRVSVLARCGATCPPSPFCGASSDRLPDVPSGGVRRA